MTIGWLRHQPAGDVLRAAWGQLLWDRFEGALRVHAAPSMAQFARAAAGVHTSAATLVAALGLGPQERVSAAVEEHAGLDAELAGRYRGVDLVRPRDWAVERETSLLLYLLVRLATPGVAVETGVANGHSSFFLLRALDRNGSGCLHSIDVRPDVGALLDDRERARWSLHVLGARAAPGRLAALMPGLAPVDLFVHDSDHTYLQQVHEYRLALAALVPGGLLASDDIDGTPAFLDVCRAAGLRPHLLVDTRKVTGVARLAS